MLVFVFVFVLAVMFCIILYNAYNIVVRLASYQGKARYLGSYAGFLMELM